MRAKKKKRINWKELNSHVEWKINCLQIINGEFSWKWTIPSLFPCYRWYHCIDVVKVSCFSVSSLVLTLFIIILAHHLLLHSAIHSLTNLFNTFLLFWVCDMPGTLFDAKDTAVNKKQSWSLRNRTF